LIALKAFCESKGFPLGIEQLTALATFEQDLYDTNEVMNLTRIKREDCEVRHFIDSLLIAPLIGQGFSVLDIGTGPGFPSWPLACARPDLHVTTVDSNGKMLGFLRRHPLPNLETVQGRAEEFERRESFEIVTGRALAPLAPQLELSAAFAKVGGLVLPYRTLTERADCEAFPAGKLGLRLAGFEEAALTEEIIRLFPIFEKVAETPKKFPRPWAQIKVNPLRSER